MKLNDEVVILIRILYTGNILGIMFDNLWYVKTLSDDIPLTIKPLMEQ